MLHNDHFLRMKTISIQKVCHICEDTGAAIPLLLYVYPHCATMVHTEERW